MTLNGSSEWFNEDYLAALSAPRCGGGGAAGRRSSRAAPQWTGGWRVLDVGCGPGRHAAALDARRAARPIGLDLSRALLRALAR